MLVCRALRILQTCVVAHQDAKTGSHVVVAGVAVQLAGYLVFDALFVHFYYQVYREKHPLLRRYNTLLLAIIASSMLVVLRSIYRVAEMGAGWDGPILSREWPLYSFDSTFVLLAVAVLNAVFPGAYLPKQFSWRVQPQTDEEAYRLNNFDPNGRPDKWGIRDEEAAVSEGEKWVDAPTEQPAAEHPPAEPVGE